MKKLFILLALLVCACIPARAEAPVILIATDLHYLSPQLTDNGPFFNGLVSAADGKVMLYIDPLCEAFTEQVIACAPDALVLSGDLTFNGERQSHVDLAAKLQRIVDAGIPVLVLPGNHDLNTSAHAFCGDGYTSVENVTAAQFREIYAAMGYDDALACDPASLSYVRQLTEDWRILMLDVNTPEAPGAVRPETLAWVQRQLEDARSAGARVIAVSHQNLLGHNALFTANYIIGGADQLEALYAAGPVVCNVSGHMHIQHIRRDGSVPEIVTSALSVYPNQYGVLTLGDAAGYETASVDVSAWAERRGLTDEALLDFAAYSEEFFRTTAAAQAVQAIWHDADIPELAAWFAELNTAYFSGRMDQADLSGDHPERWQQQPSFMATYIRSILMEEPQDHTRVVLPLP